MAKEKEYKTKINLLSEGSLIKVYGSKTFLNIAPAYNIDRVRFSIVDIGSGGKNFLDIFLTVEEVRQFVEKWESGEAKKRIAADTGNYPTAYQWVKGTNGCKKLVIGGGQKGIRVQLVNNEKKINKFSVIQPTDVEDFVFFFKLTSGQIPVMEGSYYHKLYSAFIEAEAKYASTYENADIEEEISENTNSAPTTESSEDGVYTTVSKGSPMMNNGLHGIPIVITETGEAAVLVFKPEVISTLSWFDTYEQQVKIKDVTMKVKAIKKKNNLFFLSVA